MVRLPERRRFGCRRQGDRPVIALGIAPFLLFGIVTLPVGMAVLPALIAGMI
jgi:hypothetical protein